MFELFCWWYILVRFICGIVFDLIKFLNIWLGFIEGNWFLLFININCVFKGIVFKNWWNN